MKKTKKWWEKSNIDLSKYLTEPTEIDEELYNTIAETVSPAYCSYGLIQDGDPEFEKDGVLHHMTASLVNGKYFYLGILPKFKKPKY
jgi:hypothetical protein